MLIEVLTFEGFLGGLSEFGGFGFSHLLLRFLLLELLIELILSLFELFLGYEIINLGSEGVLIDRISSFRWKLFLFLRMHLHSFRQSSLAIIQLSLFADSFLSFLLLLSYHLIEN
jgi:hypothetical protein